MERTVTFTMEDALISPEGFMILSGAGLIDSTENKPVYQHVSETIDISDVSVAKLGGEVGIKIKISNNPYQPGDGDKRTGDFAYVMFVKDGEIVSEPYIPAHVADTAEDYPYVFIQNAHDNYNTSDIESKPNPYAADQDKRYKADHSFITKVVDTNGGEDTYVLDYDKFDSVIVDYYVVHASGGAQQIEISADKFGGNYYLEASTLFRDQRGVDMPAEFIIPNCKIQSNFTFTMASSGDPSTFTFTMDAFPDYTRFDHSKKVLAAIQIIKTDADLDSYRTQTSHNAQGENLMW